MTRLEQALRWWGSPRRDADPIPDRHYKALDDAGYFTEPCDDEVDLNILGEMAMNALGYHRHPQCFAQWVRTAHEERGTKEGE